MDEKLLRRVQATGAILIGMAYFLPWASIMSPLTPLKQSRYAIRITVPSK